MLRFYTRLRYQMTAENRIEKSELAAGSFLLFRVDEIQLMAQKIIIYTLFNILIRNAIQQNLKLINSY